MRYVEVGGVRVSSIGLGTWQFGSRQWGYGESYAGREAVAITRRALDLGVTLIDTAEVYAYGRSERIVGEAIVGRRDEVFLASKLFPAMPLSRIVVWRGQASARRIGVARLDLYQVHAPNPLVPFRLTMQGMATLRERGIIDHVGVSNYSLAQWQDAEVALGGPVLSNQVRYSLATRQPEGLLLPWAQEHDRLVIAYSPLAQGLLSGHYDETNRPSNIRRINPLFLPQGLRAAAPMIQTLREVAAGHGATPAQVALAWLIRRRNVVAIPGARTVAQLESNVAAADLELSGQEDLALSSASDGFIPPTKADVRRFRVLRVLSRR